MQLTHTVLVVSNLQTCVQFYRDVLGFEVLAGSETGPFVIFSSGSAMLGLFDRAATPEEFRRTAPRRAGGGEVGEARFALAVLTDDVDATFERLRTKGVRYILEPKDFPTWGFRSSLCEDPAGNPIEIYSPLPGQKGPDL